MTNDLLLLSGADIPFPGARISIHQPSIKEISLIGEESFLIGSRLLNFNKKDFEQDKNDLDSMSDFNIFMSVITDGKNAKYYKSCVVLTCTLLFPSFDIRISKEMIMLSNKETQKVVTVINDNNFNELSGIIEQMFCIKEIANDEGEFNPSDAFANKIAEKLKKGRDKVAKLKGASAEKTERGSIYAKYASILSIGLQMDINILMELTVPQLLDNFNRLQSKISFDTYIQAKMAGAENVDEVEHWMM